MLRRRNCWHGDSMSDLNSRVEKLLHQVAAVHLEGFRVGSTAHLAPCLPRSGNIPSGVWLELGEGCEPLLDSLIVRERLESVDKELKMVVLDRHTASGSVDRHTTRPLFGASVRASSRGVNSSGRAFTRQIMSHAAKL